MKKQFIKNGTVKTFEIIGEKVLTNIHIDGKLVCNPKMKDFLNDGWQEYERPVVQENVPQIKTYIASYNELVEQYIREHGYSTYGAELAVINNYAQDSEKYKDAYEHYMSTRIAAKEWANEQPHRNNDEQEI